MNLMTLVLSAPPAISEAPKEVEESLNVLDLAMKGGWIMIVLAILSVIGIYIFIDRLVVLTKAMKKNPMLLDRVKDNLKENDVKSAYNYCEKQNTPVSRIIAKGVKDYRFDPVSIRQALDNSAGLEIANLEKGMPLISTISAVAPMLGFLGTVTGMVQAFWQMSNAGNNIDVTMLSGGIYEAMVTTVGGLIVGIIAIFAYNYLVSRVDKVQNMMEAQIIQFLEIVAECKDGVDMPSVEENAVPVSQPVTPYVAQPISQPVAQAANPYATQPVSQPVAQPVAQYAATQPISQPISQPVVQPVSQPVAQPVEQYAATQPISQPVAQPVSQPVAQHVAQPVEQYVASQPVSQPVAPVQDPNQNV